VDRTCGLRLLIRGFAYQKHVSVGRQLYIIWVAHFSEPFLCQVIAVQCVWRACDKWNKKELQELYFNINCRVVFLMCFNTTSALNSLYGLPIQQRINFKLAILGHRSLHNADPQYMSSLLHPDSPSRQLRSASLNLLSLPHINIALVSRGFRLAGPSLWNSLTHHLRSTDSYTVFKCNLKTPIFSGASISDP